MKIYSGLRRYLLAIISTLLMRGLSKILSHEAGLEIRLDQHNKSYHKKMFFSLNKIQIIFAGILNKIIRYDEYVS